MMVGDFLDAMAGYREGENERIKSLAEIVRTSTAILWNIQVDKDSRLPANELWMFPWENNDDGTDNEMPDEEMIAFQEKQKKYLEDHF